MVYSVACRVIGVLKEIWGAWRPGCCKIPLDIRLFVHITLCDCSRLEDVGYECASWLVFMWCMIWVRVRSESEYEGNHKQPARFLQPLCFWSLVDRYIPLPAADCQRKQTSAYPSGICDKESSEIGCLTDTGGYDDWWTSEVDPISCISVTISRLQFCNRIRSGYNSVLLYISHAMQKPWFRVQYNFKAPVTWSTRDFGPGPIPSTVALPAAIWVLPASCMTFAVRDNDIAAACSIKSSSSDLVCRATLACPAFSHRFTY